MASLLYVWILIALAFGVAAGAAAVYAYSCRRARASTDQSEELLDALSETLAPIFKQESIFVDSMHTGGGVMVVAIDLSDEKDLRDPSVLEEGDELVELVPPDPGKRDGLGFEVR